MKRDIEKDQNFSGKIPPNTFYDAATLDLMRGVTSSFGIPKTDAAVEV